MFRDSGRSFCCCAAGSSTNPERRPGESPDCARGLAGRAVANAEQHSPWRQAASGGPSGEGGGSTESLFTAVVVAPRRTGVTRSRRGVVVPGAAGWTCSRTARRMSSNVGAGYRTPRPGGRMKNRVETCGRWPGRSAQSRRSLGLAPRELSGSSKMPGHRRSVLNLRLVHLNLKIDCKRSYSPSADLCYVVGDARGAVASAGRSSSRGRVSRGRLRVADPRGGCAACDMPPARGDPTATNHAGCRAQLS